MDASGNKRILAFSTAYFPLWGGAEVAVREIAERLVPRGFSFDLVTARFSEEHPKMETMGAVTVHRVGPIGTLGKFLLPIFGTWKALSLSRNGKYSVLWSVMASQASIAASFSAMLLRLPLVLTLQEGDEEEHLARYVGGSQFLYKVLIAPWHNLVFRRADLVTAISGYLKERALSKGVKCPVKVVPNGVDLDLFGERFYPEKITVLREKLGKREGDLFLVTTSRLVKKNAVADVIAALAHLPSNVKFLIIGEGADEAKLKALAAKLGVDSRVIFQGHVPHRDIPPYLRASDIFVRPSLSEGMGNSFIEAMAAETPVIATPVGGITDFLFDPERNPDVLPTGLFAKTNDPQSIADQVNKFTYDAELRKSAVKNARDLVFARYGWEKVADLMERAFGEASKASAKR
jgi:glycosyltransferase involved in cell wall biosynthesis